MKVVKNINNNVSLCIDSQGREVIAFGIGIGFAKPPYEVPLSKITRTFYDINANYFSVIAGIDESIIQIATEIIDYANIKLNNRYSDNVIFTLADHIQFAITRERENIHIKLPLYYEVQSLYPSEMRVGMFALSLIENQIGIKLAKEEAASITFHLIDYGTGSVDISQGEEKTIIEKCTDVVEVEMDIKINKKGFNYSRFVTHMHYLLDRAINNQNMSTENHKMFQVLKDEYPKTYDCTLSIEKAVNIKLNEEELLYLILHVNRLCAREDCYQQGFTSE